MTQTTKDSLIKFIRSVQGLAIHLATKDIISKDIQHALLLNSQDIIADLSLEATAPLPLKAFCKPTFPELELYATKIGFPILQINKFFDHYEANGWKVGRVPMKSWQAAMRNWKNNLNTYSTPNGRAVGGNF